MIIHNHSQGERFVLDFPAKDTVKQLKSKVYDQTGIPSKHQKLIFGGYILRNQFPLIQYGINPDSEIELMITLTGGADSGGGCNCIIS
eukprot:TRINITY_DN1036_c1_g1_i1.p1 TRINITY_DN1036_c1_g1~~TRINITY_DN1036_c1_g1_i1.p1  ORF type:complete len:88 (+),score=8.08 TRINITY_DN1036_c1_g1_i1:336-599(+)